MPQNNHFDIIILGGGISGLATSALLNKSFNTALIDKEPHLGGCLINFQRNGFSLDAGTQSFVTSYALKKLFSLTGIKIHFTNLEHGIIINDKKIKLNKNNFIKIISNYFPASSTKKTLKILFKYITIFKLLFESNLIYAKFDNDLTNEYYSGSYLEKFKKFIYKNDSLTFIEKLKMIYYALLHKNILDNFLNEIPFNDLLNQISDSKPLISFLKGIIGYPNQSVITAMYFWLEILFGSLTPQNGIYQLISELQNKSEADIFLNTKITKINKENEQFILTDAKNNSFTSKILISAIDLHQYLIISNIKYTKLPKFKPEKAILAIWFGYNNQPSDLQHSNCCYFSATPPESLSLEPRNFYKNGSYRLFIKNQNHKTIFHFQIIASYDLFEYIYDDSPKKYAEYKQEIIDYFKQETSQTLNIPIEEIIPLSCATPLTYHRYTNTYKGSSVGNKYSLTTCEIKKTINSLATDNLHFIGQWATIGGVSTAIHSALNLSEKLNKTYEE